MTVPMPVRCLLALLMVAAWSGKAARAQDQGAAAAGAWFVPPPASAAPHATVDMTLVPGTETITIIAKRPSRSWRSTVATDHQNDPRASDAARPDKSFANQQPYCNSALRTVGGQPGTAAAMQTGSGAGGC